VILDTGVLIAGARGRIDMAALGESDDVALPAIAVAEYRVGSLLDPDPGRAAAQQAFLDEVLSVLPVCEYDRTVAEHHAALLADVRRNGSKGGAHDLIVAAIARANERAVLTTDGGACFGELPGVTARVIAG
jgi:tRNA(fMet)-specific endonuclease VapC